VPRTTAAGALPAVGPLPIPEIDSAYMLPSGVPTPAPCPANGNAINAKGFEINKIETKTKEDRKAREQIFNEDKGDSYPTMRRLSKVIYQEDEVR
jgi:hypothetical protein